MGCSINCLETEKYENEDVLLITEKLIKEIFCGDKKTYNLEVGIRGNTHITESWFTRSDFRIQFFLWHCFSSQKLDIMLLCKPNICHVRDIMLPS